MKKEVQTLVPTTKAESLTVYEPETLSRQLVQVRSVSDALAIADHVPTIGALKREYGTEKIEDIIKLYLIDFCELVNLKRPLTEKQIDNIAFQVVANHSCLTIADVHVIFIRAKTGELGTFYESLDMPKVLKWFADYFEERCNTAADQSQNNRVWDKGENITSKAMTKYFNNLERKIKK